MVHCLSWIHELWSSLLSQRFAVQNKSFRSKGDDHLLGHSGNIEYKIGNKQTPASLICEEKFEKNGESVSSKGRLEEFNAIRTSEKSHSQQSDGKSGELDQRNSNNNGPNFIIRDIDAWKFEDNSKKQASSNDTLEELRARTFKECRLRPLLSCKVVSGEFNQKQLENGPNFIIRDLDAWKLEDNSKQQASSNDTLEDLRAQTFRKCRPWLY